MIQTQFEIDGNFSSSAFGQQFMVDLSNETGVPLFSIGQSYLGAEIYGMEFGAGEDVILITGGVHRSEPASREMVMMKCRDIAYNTDGKYTNYLNTHKIIIIPTISPDVTTRNNAQGLNINRDAYDLETTEMPHLMKFVTETKPQIYIDFHERGGTGVERVEFINPSNHDPNVSNLVRTANAQLEDAVRTNLESKGYDTAQYPQSGIGPGKTVSASVIMGALTLTPETYINVENTQYRIDALSETFEEILSWHQSNTNLLRNISSQDTELNPGDYFVLLNGDNEYYTNATRDITIVPKGYQLDDGASFELWKNTYQIEVDADGFIPISQPSSRLIPHLLDIDSEMRVVNATRVEPDIPDKRTDGRYTKVLMDEWREVFIKYM